MFDVLHLDAEARVVESVRFFVYDSVKIGLLLIGIIFAVTFGRSYLSVELHGEIVDPSIGLTLGQRVEIAGEKVRTSCTGSGPISSSGSALVRSSTVGVLGCPFTRYAGVGNPFAVLVAVAIGVPLHSNVAGVMPLVQAQTSRGSLGIKA